MPQGDYKIIFMIHLLKHFKIAWILVISSLFQTNSKTNNSKYLIPNSNYRLSLTCNNNKITMQCLNPRSKLNFLSLKHLSIIMLRYLVKMPSLEDKIRHLSHLLRVKATTFSLASNRILQLNNRQTMDLTSSDYLLNVLVNEYSN
jgi:hypothetical protein